MLGGEGDEEMVVLVGSEFDWAVVLLLQPGAEVQLALLGDSTPRMLVLGSIRRASGRAHGAGSSI